MTGNPKIDAKLAKEAAGLTETPENYVWHHNVGGKNMDLVPADIHSKTGHTGGMALTKAEIAAAAAAAAGEADADAETTDITNLRSTSQDQMLLILCWTY